MTVIMIKVTPQIAKCLKLKCKGDADADGLLQLIDSYNASLGSPTGSVGEASLYYSVENVDSQLSEELRHALATLPGVEASYIKPSDELP